MKRIFPMVVLAGLFISAVVPADAALFSSKPKTSNVPTAGLEFSKTMTQITGIAISPLLGVGAVGAYQYFHAQNDRERAALPWFANPLFWAPCLLLVTACALKDAFGTVIPPGLKKPFDAMEVMENKLTGLVAAGAVVPELVNSASKALTEAVPPSSFHGTLHFGGFAMIHLGAVDFSWLLDLLLVPFGILIFAVVWIAAHAINVLILLSPWGAVDAALKAARTSLLALLTTTAMIDPKVGAGLSLVIIVAAYFVSGWSFRLTVFGTLFCWDFFTRRRTRFAVEPDANKLFTGRKINGVPVRTYGRLYQTPGGLVLRFRPWLVLPQRELAVPFEGLAVGRGVFYSEVQGIYGGANRTLLLLPPRYLGHEQEFARVYRVQAIRDVGLRRAWSWLKETLGFAPKKPAGPVTA